MKKSILKYNDVLRFKKQQHVLDAQFAYNVGLLWIDNNRFKKEKEIFGNATIVEQQIESIEH
ncbi:hypothetical protein [Leptospira santarosai]|uniref:hypothetical protein n=1 Tax=Leptospira santarosai TaxID=28183 RepID=UPI0002BF1D19|nr:hypothetical protein [Leptospira santarosai]EMJ49358.1 hypothetical protein LEP1GSC169_1274 [Leptospira santarosai str. HAI1349]EMO14523.1 hypothetical protein LEP1GSC165_2491 [Leptospira santarosai str. CBC523]MDI7157812.1 hypothetical protein [Leptospira santarosai]